VTRELELESEYRDRATEYVGAPLRGMEGEPLTWEGQIRLVGRLGYGASSLPRWLRWTMTSALILVVAVVLAAMIIGFVRLGL
jgi:hypothetical protein